MVANKTTIWALNFTKDLLAGTEELKNQVLQELGEDKVCFGDRTKFGDGGDNPVNLMQDIEYFVPIMPKCFGKYLDNPPSELVGNIKDYYENEAKQLPYKEFWKDDPARDYRMKTDSLMGYYEILEQTAPNILAGYSQGGLVARYLYWLDKYVFKKNVVSAVITVSPADFGSPLANRDNKDEIFLSLFEIVKIALTGTGFGGEDDRVKHKTLRQKVAAHLEEEVVMMFLKHIWEHNDKKIEGTEDLTQEEKEKRAKFSAFLQTLHDWLGGLNNDPNNAFFDLNLMRMEPNYSEKAAKYSVLASTNNGSGADAGESDPPLYGIMSGNNSFGDFIFDIAFDIIRIELEKCVSTHPVLEKFVEWMGLDLTGKPISLGQGELEKRIEQIDYVYNNKIMREYPTKPLTNKIVKEVIAGHETGVADPEIPAKDQDFIIPSAYQLNTDTSGALLPGQSELNPEANHLSGSSPNFAAGMKNREILIKYLKEIVN